MIYHQFELQGNHGKNFHLYDTQNTKDTYEQH